MEAELKELKRTYEAYEQQASREITNAYLDAAAIMIDKFNAAMNRGKKTMIVTMGAGRVYRVERELFVSWFPTSRIRFNDQDGSFIILELGRAVSIEIEKD